MWGNIANPPEWKVRNVIINIGAIDPKLVHLADWVSLISWLNFLMGDNVLNFYRMGTASVISSR